MTAPLALALLVLTVPAASSRATSDDGRDDVRATVIGESVDGRKIRLYDLDPTPPDDDGDDGDDDGEDGGGGDGGGGDDGSSAADADAEGRTTVVLIGQIHGDEQAGYRIARRLVEHPGLVPDDVHLYVIPTMNPDGRAAKDRHNAHGVDLNRNFTRRWRAIPRSSPYYSGPGPLSEPESRAVRDALKQLRPDYVVNIHQPLGGVDSYQVKDRDLMRRLSRNLDLPVKSFSCHGGCFGSLTTWYNGRPWGASIVVELDRRVSAQGVRRITSGILASL